MLHGSKTRGLPPVCLYSGACTRKRYRVTSVKRNPCVSGYVNSQNNRYWSANKLNTIHEVPLHDSKIYVWCAISRRRIIGPIFFQETVNSQPYTKLILEEFIICVMMTWQYVIFNKTEQLLTHIKRNNVLFVLMLDDRLISKRVWPPRSPDLSPCNFYLWGFLKDKVYTTHPLTTKDLKINITSAVQEITPAVLRQTSSNKARRV